MSEDSLGTATDDVPDGYRPTIRTLHGTVTGLRLARGWGDDPFDDGAESEPSPVHASIVGTLTLLRDAVSIIGTSNVVRTMPCVIRQFADRADLAKRWNAVQVERGALDNTRTDANDQSAYAKLRACVLRAQEEFVNRPPTAAITFMAADWELGWKDEWSIECDISASAFSALEADILAGRCDEISLSVKLWPTLTRDHYAPPSVPIVVGIPKGSYGSAGVEGWCTGISWRTPDTQSEGENRQPDPIEDRETSVVAGQPSAVDASSVNALTEQVAGLATTVRRGFVLLLILIGLAALMR